MTDAVVVGVVVFVAILTSPSVSRCVDYLVAGFCPCPGCRERRKETT